MSTPERHLQVLPDDTKVIPIESHPRFWFHAPGIRPPKQTRAPHQRRKTPGLVYSPSTGGDAA